MSGGHFDTDTSYSRLSWLFAERIREDMENDTDPIPSHTDMETLASACEILAVWLKDYDYLMSHDNGLDTYRRQSAEHVANLKRLFSEKEQ